MADYVQVSSTEDHEQAEVRKGHDEPDLTDLTNSNHFEQDETTRPEVGGKANAAAELR